MTDALERTPPAVATPGRVLLASLSAAAGAIHLVMVPSHTGTSVVEGIGFAAAGWLQITLAALLVRSPSRAVLRLTIVANLAFIAAWAVSRTVGLPFGEHAWHPEEVSFLDGTCVGIEAALILACGLVLARPGLGRGWDRSRLAFGAFVPIGVIALTTAVLASPGARDHAAGSHGEHAAAGSHGEHAAAGDHAHGAEGDELGLAALQNGHQHGSGEVELDAQTQAALTTQLAPTFQLMQRYPTLAAAEAAGYRRAGPFAPGLGTHYINYAAASADDDGDGLIDSGDALRPMLIYDGLGPEAPLAGFMYYNLGGSAPEGFAGPNDHWHYHTNTCVVYQGGNIEAPFGADLVDVTKEMCDGVGGSFLEVTGYMVHVWTVPGYESERGVFSEINPAITCPDGSYHMKPQDELGFSTTACRDA